MKSVVAAAGAVGCYIGVYCQSLASVFATAVLVVVLVMSTVVSVLYARQKTVVDAISQAPCTYTSVRGSSAPRFYPLPDTAWG